MQDTAASTESESLKELKHRHPSIALAFDGGDALISQAQWTHFDQEGYVVLPRSQVFAEPAEFEALSQRLNEIQLGEAEVPYDKMMMQLDSTTGRYEDSGAQTLGFKGPTLRYRKIQNLDLDSLVMEYLRKPLFRAACDRIYSPSTPIASFRTMFFQKPPSTVAGTGGTRLPWHQDRWKFLDRDPLLNVYLALDLACPETGCVRFIPRSHRLGVLNKAHHSAFLNEAHVFEHCEDESIIENLILHPGEVVMMHNWVIHSSGVNSTPLARRALSVSYMDARSATVLPPEQFMGEELKTTGYAEGSNSFPVIFPARVAC